MASNKTIHPKAVLSWEDNNLDRLAEGGGSSVVLNHPSAGESLTTLGQAVRWSLKGDTRSFNAIVGYFHHYSEMSSGKGSGESRLNDDPARIIIEEAMEEAIRLFDEEEGAAPQTRFRLLAGLLCSPAATVAARLWYWTCRWRASSDEAQVASDRFRARFLTRTVELKRQDATKETAFQDACRELLDPNSEVYSKTPGPVHLGARFVEQLGLVGQETREHLQNFWDMTRYTLGADLELPEEFRKAHIPSMTGNFAKNLQATAILYGFLLQRCAEFKIAPGHTRIAGVDPSVATVATFHPKIYIIEREGEHQDTISFLGSNNWSDKALGSVWTGWQRLGNVEAATVHASHGHCWEQAPDEEPTNLGQCVSRVGHYIYHTVGTAIGQWCDRSYEIVDVYTLYQELARYTKPTPKIKRENTDISPPSQVIEGLDEIALELKVIVEKILGIDRTSYLDLISKLIQDPEARIYGGRVPSKYQLDGATRLLSILRSGPGHRGAFLTDEAGLGKTLAAKICATHLIASRIIERFQHEKSDVPLHVSLIAPARLVGKSGDTESGWHGHASEIRHAVRLLVGAYFERKRALASLENLPIPNADAKKMTSEENLVIRVLSTSGFSRELIEDREAKDQLELKQSTSSDPVRDLFHVATSEVVVIDESHNFRNQGSYGTRALRFALSLPCLGEHWKLVWDEASKNRVFDREGLVTERRVLCLSATPFNNRLDDLVTQIGHFSHHQDWSVALGNTKQASLGFDELEEAIRTWSESDMDALSDASRAREVFERILLGVYTHLRSGRSLSIDADKMLDRAAVMDEARSRITDGGPEYIWPESYEILSQQLADVYAWLRSNRNEDGSAPNDTSPEAIEARTRLDAMLCDLMVQRSRARALKITAANDSAIDIDRMFRRPRVPRYPLAINDPVRSSSSFEGTILTRLYELLGMQGNDDEDDGELHDGQLDLFAYRLGVMRGRTGSGAQVDQTIRNNLGFQRINLIKRLQSSPYSFMRTILRGPLRRTMYELALLQRLVFPLLEIEETSGRHTKELLEAHPLSNDFRDIAERILEFQETLQDEYTLAFEPLAELFGGLSEPTEALFFCEIGGFFSLERFNDLPDSAATRRFERDFLSLLEALGFTDARGVSLPDAPQFTAQTFEGSWASKLLEDISSQQSRLRHDVNVALSWTFDKKDADSLIAQLYHKLPSGTHGQSLRARPFSSLRSAFREIFDEGNFRDRKKVLEWLLHRIEKDPRVLSMIAWLMLQRAVTDRVREEHTGTAALERLREVLPGGIRTLVFTEYTDTQEYMLTVLAALDGCYRADNVDTKELDARLVEEMKRVVERLERGASTVRSGSESSAVLEVDYEGYLAPIESNSQEVMALFDALDDPASEQRTAVLRRAARSLSEHLGRVCSGTSERPLIGERGEIEVIIEDRDDVLECPPDDIHDDPVKESDVIEAFSPWYQIAPPKMATRHRQALCEKLDEAARQPVYTLLTTEVLSEGVNLQECGVVVHYDLPWNPTRLIQRNGRIDRRLFDLYEDDREREALIEELFEEGSSQEAPEFSPPSQVYHMTLLPAEPDSDVLSDRVRQRLFEKLDTIRSLFGLSYWPVVLDQETARQVLGGELDYETPGFRRREELFRFWGTLQPLTSDRHAVDAHRGSLALTMPEDFRQHLISHVLGEEAAADESVRKDWKRALRVGVVCHTPFYPKCEAVRSGPELSILDRDKDDKKGALSGVLVLSSAEDAREPRLLCWARINAMRTLLEPALMEHHPEHLKEDERGDAYLAHRVDMNNLTSTQEVSGLERLRNPSSPTAMAEEFMTSLLVWLIDEKKPLRGLAWSEGFVPEKDQLLDKLASYPSWRDAFVRALDEGSLPAEGVAPKVTERADTPELPNIWITFG